MTFLKAAEKVLREANAPLSPEQITKIALATGLIKPKGRTPVDTMGASLYLAVKQANKSGESCVFRKVARGKFAISLEGVAESGGTQETIRTEIVDDEVIDTSEEIEQIVRDLERDEVPAQPLSEVAIEAKYDQGQARIIIQRNDFLVPNILEMVKNREILDVTPNYQRRGRWNDTKRSHLIESLLMNIPIPPIFLFERDLAKYEVMDGQQRLTSIKAFFANEFKLRDLKKWPELDGRFYRDLPPRIQAGLLRRGLAAVIILTESGQDQAKAMELRQYVFERLNTGGQPLNAHEVRNCIYASPFNDMLVEVARSPLFTKAWGIPPKESGEPQHVSRKLQRNRLYATMSDCEIVLRYFALSDLRKFKGGMKRTLDDYMNDMRQLSKEQCVVLANEYLSILKIAHQVYGESLFRLPNRKGELRGRKSVPLADAVLLGIRAHKAQSREMVSKSGGIVRETQQLLAQPDSDSYRALVGRGNTKKDIEDRIGILTKMVGRSIK